MLLSNRRCSRFGLRPGVLKTLRLASYLKGSTRSWSIFILRLALQKQMIEQLRKPQRRGIDEPHVDGSAASSIHARLTAHL